MIKIEKLSFSSQADNKLVKSELFYYMLNNFQQFYPGFSEWYKTKVISGFEFGKRIIYVVKENYSIRGVAILRISDKTNKSNKICSFYVDKDIRTGGIGTQFIRKILEETLSYPQDIIITVPEERLLESVGNGNFKNFLENWGFKIIKELESKYRINKKEFVLEREKAFS